MNRLFFALALCVLGLGVLFSTVQADGIIIPDPIVCKPGPFCPPVPPPCVIGRPCPPHPRPIMVLDIKYHHVNVSIDNQVAVTRVDQVFYNPNSFPVEGTYIFPLPADAAVSRFTLWVDGKPVDGKVLDANEARKVYEEIVNTQRDPALLQYIGRGMLQAKVFPIPAGGERRIELEYSQTLTAENGLVKYIYPLNTEKFSISNLGDVAVTVDISSAQPLRAIYSPSHPVQIDRKDSTHATASYEAKDVKPDTDFTLYYSIGENEAFHLLTFRDPKAPEDADGFFLLLLAPKQEVEAKPFPKDVILVLDHSGSMDGEKFTQAQQALRYILNHLNKEDRFGLVGFSSGVELYADSLRPASESAQAVAWVDKLAARGSTDINRALLESVALAEKERPTYLIFLTDGLPTVGETRRENILDNFMKAAPKNVRLFPFGVGYDVDTFLLDTLAQDHHGLSTYIRPGEALDEAISAFYERISTPVLANLALDFGSMAVYDIYPNPLPDLFSGGQIVVVGRYRKGGTTDITLSGQSNSDSTQTFKFSEQKFSVDSSVDGEALSSLPRLWATRKVGYLLNQIRLAGADPETVAQVVKLSIRYGIVTPYTSYLVTEPMPLGIENQQKLSENTFRQLMTLPPQAASGQGAVDRSAGQGGMAQAEQAPSINSTDAQKVQLVGAHSFVFSQDTWMDTSYDPKTMTPTQVSFLSTDYFNLAHSRPELAAAFALGEKVIVVLEGQAYEVVSEKTDTTPVVIPPTRSAPTSIPAGQVGSTPVLIATLNPGPLNSPAGDQGSGGSTIAILGIVIGAAVLSVTVLAILKKRSG